ncbi:hypothetical protein CYMTET_17469 [Cymbomonas tetramitiformis]|uniref:Uncharacterized protein n=1 Tax=Cymbomonas tetramitiformis TaxID=36881 RepID=A0AAE0GAA1_9CHLO|nr:hypothetical protein CYMTET_17469 [Cymbomonas tetramitiformis]
MARCGRSASTRPGAAHNGSTAFGCVRDGTLRGEISEARWWAAAATARRRAGERHSNGLRQCVVLLPGEVGLTPRRLRWCVDGTLPGEVERAHRGLGRHSNGAVRQMARSPREVEQAPRLGAA